MFFLRIFALLLLLQFSSFVFADCSSQQAALTACQAQPITTQIYCANNGFDQLKCSTSPLQWNAPAYTDYLNSWVWSAAAQAAAQAPDCSSQQSALAACNAIKNCSNGSPAPNNDLSQCPENQTQTCPDGSVIPKAQLCLNTVQCKAGNWVQLSSACPENQTPTPPPANNCITDSTGKQICTGNTTTNNGATDSNGNPIVPPTTPASNCITDSTGKQICTGNTTTNNGATDSNGNPIVPNSNTPANGSTSSTTNTTTTTDSGSGTTTTTGSGSGTTTTTGSGSGTTTTTGSGSGTTTTTGSGSGTTPSTTPCTSSSTTSVTTPVTPVTDCVNGGGVCNAYGCIIADHVSTLSCVVPPVTTPPVTVTPCTSSTTATTTPSTNATDNTSALNNNTAALNNNTAASGKNTASLDNNTSASGNNTNALNNNTNASGANTNALNNNTNASGANTNALTALTNALKSSGGTGAGFTTSAITLKSGDFDTTMDDQLTQAQSDLKTKFASVKSQFNALMGSNFTGSGGLPVFDYGTIKGVAVSVDFSKYAAALSPLASVIYLCFVLASVRVLLGS